MDVNKASLVALHDLLQHEIDHKGRHPAAVRRELRRELRREPGPVEPVETDWFPVENKGDVLRCPKCDVPLLLWGRMAKRKGKQVYQGRAAHPDTGKKEVAVCDGPPVLTRGEFSPSFPPDTRYTLELREKCEWNNWVTKVNESKDIPAATVLAVGDFSYEAPARDTA